MRTSLQPLRYNTLDRNAFVTNRGPAYRAGMGGTGGVKSGGAKHAARQTPIAPVSAFRGRVEG